MEFPVFLSGQGQCALFFSWFGIKLAVLPGSVPCKLQARLMNFAGASSSSESQRDTILHNPIHPEVGDNSSSELSTLLPCAKRQRTHRLLQNSSEENLRSKPFLQQNFHTQGPPPPRQACVVPSSSPGGPATTRILSARTCPTLALRFPHLVKPPER